MQRKFTPRSHPFHVLFRVLITASVVVTGSSVLYGNGDPLFHIECPPDVTVDCNAELWDLTIYGNATVYGYGGPVDAGPPVSTEYNLNSCNAGSIVRTWVAYDYGGTPYSCSQTITVGGGPGYIDIQWPPDYIIHDCAPLTDPSDLPPPYDYPVINDGGGSCTQILMSHDDLTFNINPPACIKILRKWTVIDWCTYDPNAYHPEGIWEHTQIIMIKPSDPPVIYCPSDTTISAGGDCTGGYVQLPPAFGTSDCGASVILTNNSPYATSHGADASGFYPLGTTKVTFHAEDGCGQKTSCSVYITVIDMKKPTPICFYGISFPLMAMPDGYYMDLRPEFLDKGSFDNCTPKHKLKKWVEPSRVDCDNVGLTEVQLFVEDESGNVEFCTTVINVQDNLGICPSNNGVVTGSVYTASGAMIEEVKVSLAGTGNFTMTDTTGFYAFSGLPFGHAYQISPARSQDDLSGVSTLDMLRMLKHILGMELFDSPYQYIAGDLDKSGRVTVSDLTALRDLILQDLLHHNVHTSWRFVDAGFQFPDPLDPLTSGFPESYFIQSLDTDMTSLNFIGVKLGDLNHDAENIHSEESVEVRNGPIVVDLADVEFEASDVFEITAAMDAYADVLAMEFSLKLDTDKIKVLSAKSQTGGYGLDIFDLTDTEGVISTLWYGVDPLKSEHLLTLRLQALKPGRVSDVIALNDVSRARAFTHESGTSTPVVLHFGGSLADTAFLPDSKPQMWVSQNVPNPFHEQTVVAVALPEPSGIAVRVYEMSGRMVWAGDFDGVRGFQDIILDIPAAQHANLLIAAITSDFGHATIRMLASPR